MKHIDKNKDIADYTLIQENIVLKLDTKAKELLGYFFDALNYIYIPKLRKVIIFKILIFSY